MDQPSGPVHWSTTSCCRPLHSPTYYRPNHLRHCRVFHITWAAADAGKSRTGASFLVTGASRDACCARRNFLTCRGAPSGSVWRRTFACSPPFVLLSSAHTKHSSPPSPRTHTHTHALFLFLPFPPSNILHVRKSGCNEISRDLAPAGGHSLPVNPLTWQSVGHRITSREWTQANDYRLHLCEMQPRSH